MKRIIPSKTGFGIAMLVIKVIVCFSLLIGGTFALFYDSDENNVLVTAGSVEMELMTVDDNGNEVNIAGNGINIFGDDEWEPGQTRVVYFKVRSLSNIDVKYMLNLVVDDDHLNGALEYFAIEGSYIGFVDGTWNSLIQSRTIKALIEGQNSISGESHILITPNEEHYYTLFIHMREDASGYQNKTSKVDVYLYAMQGNANTD